MKQLGTIVPSNCFVGALFSDGTMVPSYGMVS